MSIYAVSAVRLNADHTRITHVMWEHLGGTQPMEYIPTEAPVIDVVDALIAGDKVILITQDESGSWAFSDAEFKPVIYQGGG